MSLRRTTRRHARALLAVACVPAMLAGLTGTPVAASPPAAARSGPVAASSAPSLPPEVAARYDAVLTLPDGARAYVDGAGQALVLGADGSVTYRRIDMQIAYDPARATPVLPSEAEMIAQLSRPPLAAAADATGLADADLPAHGATASSVAIPADVVARAAASARRVSGAATGLPSNYGVASNAQSTWMTPGLDAAKAYARITDTYGELPGTGEIITTVGIGGLRHDPAGVCGGDVEYFGPSTVVIDGQSYLDMPSLPLIPTFTADEAGTLDPVGEACPNEEFLLDTIGASVSAMAALPHDMQRAGAVGEGLTDLLGLAPGAEQRIVVPAAYAPTGRDLAGALLGAANQDPAPTVIVVTAHIGGADAGFPDRTLEDGRLLRKTVAQIVASGITVVLPAGDGVTVERTAAVGASGGGAQVDIASDADSATRRSQLRLSTAPSSVPDTGAIVVAASTTNDIFAAQPHANEAARDTQAYPTVRWTGSTTYASGYGERPDVSAPGDSVLGLRLVRSAPASDVEPELASGTAIAAAQVAAAAAVARQVGRLTGQPLDTPAAVRDMLTATARELPAVPQVAPDQEFPPQVSLGALVDNLMGPDEPGVLRVAVAQRRAADGIDATFETATDPAAIDLAGPRGPDGKPSGRNARAWITIAPDWTGVPADATYELTLTSDDSVVLSTSRSARLLPVTILDAAGSSTVGLTYTAYAGGSAIASADVSLTFGDMPDTSVQVLAPVVEPVVTGDTIDVSYDLRGVAPLDTPELVVSRAGRTNPLTGTRFAPAVTIPLDGPQGTLSIPVADLDGNGIYGVGIHYADFVFEDQLIPYYSDFGFVRVEEAPTASPAAPLVSRGKGAGKADTYASIGMAQRVTVSWDVRNVPGATGAVLEVSSPGPNLWSLTSTFSNPEGSQRDDNGSDSPSIATVPLAGTSGKQTFTVDGLSLVIGMTQGLRLLPTSDGGDVVGSASPVSSVTVTGARVVSGGNAERGFSIDPNGKVGMVTSLDWSAGLTSTVERFNQRTGKNRDVPIVSHTTVYSTAGDTAYGGSAGLAVERDQFTDEALSMSLLDDLKTGEPTPWYVPSPDRYLFAGSGADATSSTGAFLLRDREDGGSGPFRMAFGDVGAGTFGPVYDISAGMQDLPWAPEVRQVAYDATLGRAVVTFSPDMFATPIVEAVDEGSGAVTSYTLDTIGWPFGMDVLASPARAMITTYDFRLSLVDLDTGAARSIDAPGPTFGQYVVADDEHGLFLVMLPAPDDITTNNNALSALQVYDADMNVVDTMSQFNFYDTPLSPYVRQVQLDPETRTGWAVGYLAKQIVRFAY